MEKPTCKQIIDNDGLVLVKKGEQDGPSWRHGSRREDVFHRLEDDTYWIVTYRRSTDGETNDLRDGLAKIVEAEMFKITINDYRVK